ncbi:hypothetical protein C8Q78DRAFT_1060079 [Trametes maxima]|nr:hypothetical protein C8Q78DRAFT_1060079 [Trametes maxima]
MSLRIQVDHITLRFRVRPSTCRNRRSVCATTAICCCDCRSFSPPPVPAHVRGRTEKSPKDPVPQSSNSTPDPAGFSPHPTYRCGAEEVRLLAAKRRRETQTT